MKMVDISGKETTRRSALAEGRLRLRQGTIQAIEDGLVKKGDPFRAGEVAAMLAVKRTPGLIPHCHPLPVSSCSVEFAVEGDEVVCSVEVGAVYGTGVEMEALTGVSVGLLTVWDMVKYLEKDDNGQYPLTEITGIRVIRKSKTDSSDMHESH